MTTIYVNGKRVSKEEISQMEILSEQVKRMVREILAGKEKKKGA